jgi:hypothetical protein
MGYATRTSVGQELPRPLNAPESDITCSESGHGVHRRAEGTMIRRNGSLAYCCRSVRAGSRCAARVAGIDAASRQAAMMMSRLPV